VLLVCTGYSVLYSEIALSRKTFGIGHMYTHISVLRMTDTMTSQNTDLSSWDILYLYIASYVQKCTQVFIYRVFVTVVRV
jgi:hypothetical protein